MEVNYHKFPSGKRYVYVVIDSAPVFIRNALFLRNASNSRQIAVVHSWGSRAKASWEPPKGQMEWKELEEHKIRPGQRLAPAILRTYMREGVCREMMEEAKVYPHEIRGLRPLPQQYVQDWPESKVPGAKFMYQFWTAEAPQKLLLEAQKRINFLVHDKDNTEMVPADIKEKDEIRWWSPANGWDMVLGSFSKKMTALYFKDL